MQAGRAGRILSLANESRMLDFIAAAMREQLARYPTTIAEDDARLASEGLEPFCNERNAVIVVRGEKEVCGFWIEVADVARPLLIGSSSAGGATLDDVLAAAEASGVAPDPAEAAAAMCGLSLSQVRDLDYRCDISC